MNLQVTFSRLASAVATLLGAKGELRKAWRASAKVTGEEAVSTIKLDFRTGGTTSTRTAVRSGKLRAAYDNAVIDQSDGSIDLDIGLIRPSTGSQVLMYGRVHEGFDFAGNPVAEFIIVPREARHLRFPIREGGGLAASNIVGWVTTDKVRLKPRPSFPTIIEKYPPVIERRCGDDFVRVLSAGA